MSTLIEDIKAHYKYFNYPPSGGDLDYERVNEEWVKKDTETTRLYFGVIDDSPRWGDVIQAVYQRGDELVAVQDIKPATEMQDWGDYGDPEVYPVKAVEVTITKYERA